ncbi:MAG: L-threonylcarbamoyladenylate synthase [Bacteroidales bacterium]|nr:L-threonylcarbamoyladenylate synthase [Bacteroidales bacterium]
MQAEVEKTVEILQKGGLIVYPTDTLWGIGCDATNKKSIERIYQIKRRLHEKSFIVLVNSKETVLNHVKEVPEYVWDFIDSYQMPLSVIYPGAHNLPDNIIAPDKTIAIRITKDPFCRALIDALGKPLVSTSANISGEKSPFAFSMIQEEILNQVDYVVNYKRVKITETKASTIIKISEEGQIEIIRN